MKRTSAGDSDSVEGTARRSGPRRDLRSAGSSGRADRQIGEAASTIT
jgi:hypothetical protein